MNTALLELLTSSEADEADPELATTHAELAEKWARRAAFLEAFALDCRDRNDVTTALVLEAVAQAHRSDARELNQHVIP
jgi:hypothetical protein